MGRRLTAPSIVDLLMAFGLDLRHHLNFLVFIAPRPLLAGLGRSDDRMGMRMKVLGHVRVW